jgi:hypothetical protein
MADKKPSNIDVVTGKRKKMDLKIEQHITDQTAFKEQVKKCKAGKGGGDLSCEDLARTQVWPGKWKKGRRKGKVGIVPVKKKK